MGTQFLSLLFHIPHNLPFFILLLLLLLLRFYYLDDRISQVRTFDESRLDFAPCSLYLAMDFARSVFEEEEKTSGPQITDLTEDPQIAELLEKQPSSLRLQKYILQNTKEIFKSVGAEIAVLFPVEVTKEFEENFRKRVKELHGASASKVYGVGVIKSSLNNLNPIVRIRVEGPKRENYRFSPVGEKLCVLLNAVALERVNFLTPEALRDQSGIPLKKGKKMPALNQADFFTRLTDAGLNGLMVYNFDVNKVLRPQDEE